MRKSLISKLMIAALILPVISACGSKSATFSILADEANFQQNATEVNSKIDILWVVDNSGSMATSQQNLANNFRSFIRDFDTKGFDYRIAVTTSDSYKTLFGAGQNHSKFRDGTDLTSHTGVFIIDPETPNIEQTFMTNIMQGTKGSGDERAFQSIATTLSNPLNKGFPRPGAFLAIIILSDEDDFSHDAAGQKGGQYGYTYLHTVDKYVQHLDNLMLATPELRSSKYNVSSITIMDNRCLDILGDDDRMIGRRYMELSNKTNGVVASLCDDFAPVLSNISSNIIQLSTQFPLDRVPNPASIVVRVDGHAVPALDDASQAPLNGFKYNATSNSIVFYGSHIPGPGARIVVNYDPVAIK